MATYTLGFPANAPPADAIASSSIYIAPDIPPNSVPRAIDLVEAARETRSKKRARDEGRILSDAEYAAACVRQHAIESEHARIAFGNAGAPLWAVALSTQVANLITSVANLNTTLTNHMAVSGIRSTSFLIGMRAVLEKTILPEKEIRLRG